MITGTVSLWDRRAATALLEPGEARQVNTFLAGLVAGGLFWFMYRHPVIAGAGAIAASVLYFKIAPLIGVPAWRRRMLMNAHARFDHQKTYTWTDQTLSWTSLGVSESRPWAEYSRIAENKYVMLLFAGPMTSHILSKSWFRDQQQLDEFRAAASARLNPAFDPTLQAREHIARSLPYVGIVALWLLVVFFVVLALSWVL
ncbi:hypothetical protein CR152_23940 [Massilia violaceinigra]|uniref:YcxB-like C-terminal domain-containing protein n=1 Tax=Massilia violaceinigra TaxID=2045208 RepID=A0A2D2DQI6_9BURK|nr:YcxB family protein [Massilia violaceinigra]ATQ77228.1 hypothetical protein CR152_23940 [Massilia violaceinigra]